MGEQVEVTVQDNPERSRYEALVGSGAVAGFADYHRSGGRLVFTHTEVDEAFEGQGVGSALARGVLDHARATGLPVLPLCPFIRAYIDRHPEYQDLVDG